MSLGDVEVCGGCECVGGSPGPPRFMARCQLQRKERRLKASQNSAEESQITHRYLNSFSKNIYQINMD